jgi:hypothetical protein
MRDNQKWVETRAVLMNNLQSMGTVNAGRAHGDTGKKDKRPFFGAFLNITSVGANASPALDMLLWPAPVITSISALQRKVVYTSRWQGNLHSHNRSRA